MSSQVTGEQHGTCNSKILYPRQEVLYLIRHDHAGQLESKHKHTAEHASCEVDHRCADQAHKGCQQVALLRLRGDQLDRSVPKGLSPPKHLLKQKKLLD